jgi:hypothetical protein
MSIAPPRPQVLDFFGTPIVIEQSAGQLPGDAGLLRIRPFDERIGLTRANACALDDPRDPALTEHTFLEMVRARVYGILAGYADQNDHDTLRADPAFLLHQVRVKEAPWSWASTRDTKMARRCSSGRSWPASGPGMSFSWWGRLLPAKVPPLFPGGVGLAFAEAAAIFPGRRPVEWWRTRVERTVRVVAPASPNLSPAPCQAVSRCDAAPPGPGRASSL